MTHQTSSQTTSAIASTPALRGVYLYNHLISQYPHPGPDKTYATYCVGGTLCTELSAKTDHTKERQWPTSRTLARVIQDANPTLHTSELVIGYDPLAQETFNISGDNWARHYARHIIDANDYGDIGLAWEMLYWALTIPQTALETES